MTTPFLGEIQIFGFPFAPFQWALANGTTMSIQQNAALYSLLGTNFGGNGTTNFLLPNLAGRAPCNQGQGPGLSQRVIGENFGAFNVALDITTMPSHQHPMVANNPPAGATPSATPVSGAELARFDGTDAHGAQQSGCDHDVCAGRGLSRQGIAFRIPTSSLFWR